MSDKNIIEVLIHSSSKPLTQKSLDYALKDKKVNLAHLVKLCCTFVVINITFVVINITVTT